MVEGDVRQAWVGVSLKKYIRALRQVAEEISRYTTGWEGTETARQLCIPGWRCVRRRQEDKS